MHRLLVLPFAAFLLAIASPLRAEEPVAVLAEMSDGSVVRGTLPEGTEFVLVAGDKETKIAARDVVRLAVSVFREAETRALEAEVYKWRPKLAADDVKERDAASEALAALPGTAAPFLTGLMSDADPEVVMRARAARKLVQARGGLFDSRDYVALDKQVLRGWLKLENVTLKTDFGPIEIARAELRTLRQPAAPEEVAAPKENEWMPPMARMLPPVTLVAFLKDGSRLVGQVPAAALALVDENGNAVPSDRLMSLVRDAEKAGFFRVKRQKVPSVRAALVAKELPVTGASRRWTVPVESIESIEIGPLRLHRAASGSMAELVQQWEKATAEGTAVPTQRFWVYIDGQPANPWNSTGKKGMTWSLIRVHNKVCLVGADALTDAYLGDTSNDEELPILAVHKQNLPAPEGVDPKNFYMGWIGGECRLTKPVAGSELTSLEIVNSIIKDEFGDDWEVGEHHSPSGGWHWWAYWEAPEEGK
ncbi:MAG: hypothetical protein K8T20_14975 [Planctomycetes bacterium]|nr:hypothetical protein [Planctomycetota bacterium]